MEPIVYATQMGERGVIMAKMTKKEATHRLFDSREKMFTATSLEEVEANYKKACLYQSTLYPMQCNHWDCRYCYLTRMRNNAIRRVSQPMPATITVNGNVTINISINGKEA